MAEELPPHFRSPQVGKYDGFVNLEDYLCRFENVTLLHYYSDATKCRVFVTNLVNPTA